MFSCIFPGNSLPFACPHHPRGPFAPFLSSEPTSLFDEKAFVVKVNFSMSSRLSSPCATDMPFILPRYVLSPRKRLSYLPRSFSHPHVVGILMNSWNLRAYGCRYFTVNARVTDFERRRTVCQIRDSKLHQLRQWET